MPLTDDLFAQPRRMAAVCAVSATGLGLSYMFAAGAPSRYLAINAGALAVGFALAGLLMSIRRDGSRGYGVATLALGLVLLACGVFGVTAHGATRWIRVAGFSLQPSLLILPLMVVRFARLRDPLSTFGLVLASVAIALQPDRGMAGALVAGLIALAVFRPERLVLLALTAAIVGFVATLIEIDVQPAMPYVDQVFFTSFEVHPLAGLAVLGGAALIIAPAFTGCVYDAQSRHAYAVFGSTWLAVIIAAALGNYPTPLVGYGASAIIGYVLSSVTLPEIAAGKAAKRHGARSASEGQSARPSNEAEVIPQGRPGKAPGAGGR